jgi:tetratricopeptide (TPR) repeat protein
MKSPALSLELVPLESAPPPSNDAAPPVFPGAPEVIEVVAPTVNRAGDVRGAVPTADRFAREAAQQYADGHIDQPLWDRAFAQAKGDLDAAVEGYLRARATALRLLDRQLRTEQRPRPAQPATSAPATAPSGAPDDALDDDTPAAVAARAQFVRKRLLGKYRNALIAAGVAVPLLAIGAYVLLGRGATPESSAEARPAAAMPQRTAAAVPSKAPAAPGAPAENKAVVNPEFMLKLQQFRDTGNWNMVVLYSVEWTRREPSNAAAWNELRAGYANLRQYDDALAAAKKAVELAPTEAPLWRHLGNAQLDLDDPAAALAAFTEAVARDAEDTYSLQQIGLLHARQGRLPEAKSAFDLALAAKPGEAMTQCLKAGVAQLSATKDPHAAAMQVRAVDAKCHGGEAAVEPAAPAVASQTPAERAGKRTSPRS